jgi:transcriptional regulator with XRE-family HTH domain
MTENLGPSRRAILAMTQLRKARGWNVDELAEAMASQGVPWTRNIVMNAEAGRKRSITAEELVALSTLFGVPLSELVSDRPEGLVQEKVAERESQAAFVHQLADLMNSYADRGIDPLRELQRAIGTVHSERDDTSEKGQS